MNLRKVAAKFETTSFDVYDEGTKTWTPNGMQGKVLPVDRFLSIFHRATSRRELGLAPNTVLPASNTIRVPSTGEVFLIGLVRGDAAKSRYYDSIGILHRCHYTGIVKRKQVIGTGEDLGALVETVLGEHYMDLELRSVSESDGASKIFDSAYFLVTPPHTDIKQWDFVDIKGRQFQVKSAYIDSGFKFCRVIERDDPRIDITYNRKSGTSSYDPSTGVVNDGAVPYTVSGFFDNRTSTDSANPTLTANTLIFVIAESDIGFTPSELDTLIFEGLEYQITAVARDFQDKQYRLHCKV